MQTYHCCRQRTKGIYSPLIAEIGKNLFATGAFQDKNATVGVIVKNRDGVCVLAQTGGQAVGAADSK